VAGGTFEIDFEIADLKSMKVLQGYKISATADLQDSSSLIIVEDPWK
jgi:hypothetical protein